MNKYSWAYLLLGLLIIIGVPACADEPASASLAPKWTVQQYSGSEAIEQAILRLTNAERQKYGLPTVTMLTTLQVASRQHSREMGEKRYFAHESPEAAWRMPWQRAYMAGYWDEEMGENIASVHDPALTTPDAVAQRFVTMWMQSQGHRENILGARWLVSGVGVVQIRESYYATQLFARPLLALEAATLTCVDGELVKLHLEGNLRAGTIHVWVDGQHLQSINPTRGSYAAEVSLSARSGLHEVIVAVGEQGVWVAKVDTDAKGRNPVKVEQDIRYGVVTRYNTTNVTFTGMRLSGLLTIAPKETVSLLQDDTTVSTIVADKQGRCAFAITLPRRNKLYTIKVAVNRQLERLLFIDTTKPLSEAFLGRQE